MTQSWQAYLHEHRQRFLAEYLDLLRIPSISAVPTHAGDVRLAAEWTAARLQAAGIEGVRLIETAGHPLVYGEWLHAPGKPTLLIYGHFDVQPVDPLELWQSPPFEPRIEGDRVYARGASDMKGNMLFPIIACEALLRTEGRLPVNLKFMLEGEEEVGSPNLLPVIAANRELFACDYVVSADSGQAGEDQASISLGTRGLCGLQIDLRTAAIDLHSGTGGATPNPIHALVRLLDSMRAADGTITVAGFYEHVRPISEQDRHLMRRSPDVVPELMARVGLKASFGEPGFTPQERMTFRPTLEVNGIWGGYQGEGTKTVIPCEAHAKITCRLVPDQTPAEILAKLRAHIEAHTPPYASVTIQAKTGSAYPDRVAVDHPWNQALEAVLQEMYGKAPWVHWAGGTVPAIGMLKQELGVSTISLGFSLKDEQVHAPNEFFRISSYGRGQEAYCRYFKAVGG